MTESQFGKVDRTKALVAAFVKQGRSLDNAHELARHVMNGSYSSYLPAQLVLTCADSVDLYAALLRDDRLDHDSPRRIAAYVAVPEARAAIEAGDCDAALEALSTIRKAAGVIPDNTLAPEKPPP